MRGGLQAVAAVLLLAHANAGASEPWESADGKSSLELRAFYKSFAGGLRMQRGLVDSAGALDDLLASARAELPPEQASLLPPPTSLPLYGGFSAHTARVWGRLLLRERLELQAGWQLAAMVASDRAFAGGAALGTSVPSSVTARAARRLVDFEPTLASRGGFVLQHDLDLLAAKLRLPFADLTVGRQVLSWGSGRFWNPTDLLSPFGPADLDREVRRGVDAVRASIPLAATAQLELLWLPQRDAREQGGVARGTVNVLGFDLAPSVAKYGRDLVVGFDTSGDVGPVGVHGEAAWTRAFDASEDGTREEFVRAVAGADVRPLESLVLTGEYYFNGYGARDPSGYLDVLRSAREQRGEVFGAGRHYLGVAAAWSATELLSVQGVALANVADPSVMFVPALEYWAEQSVLVRLNGSVPMGRPPDASGLRRLTARDLVTQSDDFRRETQSLGLRSEYGASPWGVFAQVAVYFL